MVFEGINNELVQNNHHPHDNLWLFVPGAGGLSPWLTTPPNDGTQLTGPPKSY